MAMSKTDGHAKIAVAGDICLDVLSAPIPPQCGKEEGCDNWRLTGETRTTFVLGGAALMARLLAHATGESVAGPVIGYPPEMTPGKNDPSHLPETQALLGRLTRFDVVHSTLGLCAENVFQGKDKKSQWRVLQVHGFSGPDIGSPKLVPVIREDHPEVELVVLDDPGNGFRNDRAHWPAALREAGKPACIVHKLHRPLPGCSAEGVKNNAESELWRFLQSNFHDRHIVVLDINDLRLAGAEISSGLSWEKTALELLWHLRGDTRFAALRDCRHLVIRLGMDGAICYHGRGLEKIPEVQLVFDPNGIEEGWQSCRKAGMVGIGSAFTAWVAASLFARDPALWKKAGNEADMQQVKTLSEAAALGLTASRRLFQHGFGPSSAPSPDYPGPDAFRDLEREAGDFVSIAVPVFAQATQPDPHRWTILDSIFPPGSKLEESAEKALRQDKVKELRQIPLGVFKKLRTYDRFEIEAYRSLCTIMREYLQNLAPKRPLCIAVFGPPGSGKSFGVQQVAEFVRGDCALDTPTFNLSQFRDTDELTSAFHLIRDSCVRGHVPLVFFDEFDAKLGNERLGWLKHFLAPMQDGLFMDRGAAHPIGKAIFVFAGGVYWRFDDFAVEKALPNGQENPKFEMFRDAKVSDFVSRLRARLDVVGIEHEGLPTAAVLLRRAAALRFQLSEKARSLFDAEGNLQIDDGLARALLQVPKYRHGMRSMEAILDMSRLAGCRTLIPSCLPASTQLALHVEDQVFRSLVSAPSSFGDDLDLIARAIHEDYLKEREADGSLDPTKYTHLPWDKLSEEIRGSNREQANMIPIRLRSIGLYTRKLSRREEAGRVKPSEDQIEKLARQEHERWMSEKLLRGWVYGDPRDNDRRMHPCLLSWDDPRLPESEKDKDRQTIRMIPTFLASGGWGIVQ